MVKRIRKGVAKLGEVGLLGPSIITGANLCQRSSKKPKSAPPATPAKAVVRPAPSKATKRRSG